MQFINFLVDCSAMSWIRRRGHHLQDNDHFNINEVTEWNTCKEHCVNMAEWGCISFDINYATKICYLSRMDAHDGTLAENILYDYGEDCQGEYNKSP